MSQPVLPPPQTHSSIGTAVAEVGGVVKRLDPNMLAVLLLTVVLNGMFFYVYIRIADAKHIEFMAALNSCPIPIRSPQ
jgi:hypothetical protein